MTDRSTTPSPFRARVRGPDAWFLPSLVALLSGLACGSPVGVFQPLEIATMELPHATPGVAYSESLSATGGDGTYTWTVPAGALPDGLSLSPSGRVTGVPSETEIAFFAVTVTSGDGQSAGQALVMEVSAGPRLVTPEIGAVLDNGCSFDTSNPMTWDFDWEDVPGASSYHLVVRGAGATRPLIDRSGLPGSSFHFETTGGYIITDNTRGWRWRVRALVEGTFGAWSVERIFHVEPNNWDCP